jgi:uncharacterized membrane protein
VSFTDHVIGLKAAQIEERARSISTEAVVVTQLTISAVIATAAGIFSVLNQLIDFFP